MQTAAIQVPFVRAVDCSESDVYGRFVIEASTIGLKPGDIPRLLRTDLGNGMELIFRRVVGEAFVYVQMLGCVELHILND